MDINESSKVVILGSQNVGKSCFAIRCRHRCDTSAQFDANTSPTIGASYNRCYIKLNDTELRYDLWDTAGQERFRSMAPIYYRNADAAIIVFDITSEQSFLSLDLWLKELRKHAINPIIICLVGNKCDLEAIRVVSHECAAKYAQSICAEYFEVSAFTDTGIDDVFTHIATKLIESSKRNRDNDQIKNTDLTLNNISIDSTNNTNYNRYSCC